MNQQIHIYKYVQSQIIMLHETVAVTLVTSTAWLITGIKLVCT